MIAIDLSAPRDAIISADGRHRYLLHEWLRPCGGDLFAPRPVSARELLLWIMLNPSTADARSDDPTVRKVRGFTQRLGFDGYLIANLFSFRSSKPANLTKVPDPNDAASDDYLRAALLKADAVIVAWGAHMTQFTGGTWAHRDRAGDVLAMVAAAKIQARALAITPATAAPQHPLMAPYDSPVVVYPPDPKVPA